MSPQVWLSLQTHESYCQHVRWAFTWWMGILCAAEWTNSVSWFICVHRQNLSTHVVLFYTHGRLIALHGIHFAFRRERGVNVDHWIVRRAFCQQHQSQLYRQFFPCIMPIFLPPFYALSWLSQPTTNFQSHHVSMCLFLLSWLTASLSCEPTTTSCIDSTIVHNHRDSSVSNRFSTPS